MQKKVHNCFVITMELDKQKVITYARYSSEN